MDWVSPEVGVSWVCFPSAFCFVCSFFSFSHGILLAVFSDWSSPMCAGRGGGEGTAFCRTEAQAGGRWQLQSCADHTCTPGWDCMAVPRVPQQPPSHSGGTGGAREACARGLGQPLLLSEGAPALRAAGLFGEGARCPAGPSQLCRCRPPLTWSRWS